MTLNRTQIAQCCSIQPERCAEYRISVATSVIRQYCTIPIRICVRKIHKLALTRKIWIIYWNCHVETWIADCIGITYKPCGKYPKVNTLEIYQWARRFYRAMHFSAKRGIAIACRLSVCPSVRLSVCDVGELWSHRLEFFKNNFTIS